jgi:hypothetical protein
MESFCSWANEELQVEEISHSALYKKREEGGDEIIRLRMEARGLLDKLELGRKKGSASGRKTLASLEHELKMEKSWSQSLLDQLTMVRAELDSVKLELRRVRGGGSSHRTFDKTVVYLKSRSRKRRK